MKKNKTKALEFKLDSFDDEAGIIKGYGAVKHNSDSYNDVILDGAFTKTMMDRPKIPFLYQHDPDQQIGAVKLLGEDQHGLLIEAKYYLNTTEGKEKYELAKSNLENELNTSFSIGYRVKDRSYGEQDGEQVMFLKEIDLHEISHVTFPANELAIATSIKSDSVDVREIENCLRDAGLSIKNAKTFASKIKSELCDEVTEEEEETEELVESTEDEQADVSADVEPKEEENEEKSEEQTALEIKEFFQAQEIKNLFNN